MPNSFQLDYWIDGEWYVGRLRGVPGAFSQGATLEELEENVRDAYQMILDDEEAAPADAQSKALVIDS